MMEILQIPFIQKALIGGVILAVLLSILSLFINLKNWSFITVGISHAAFGGLAIGLFLGISPPLTGMIFAALVGLLIGYISRRGDIHEDISIGILFSYVHIPIRQYTYHIRRRDISALIFQFLIPFVYSFLFPENNVLLLQ
jgi:ABC-type Mn2+/Zn2+ transport system permease subunit